MRQTEKQTEKCGRCGKPTPTEELTLWDGVCSDCAGMNDESIATTPIDSTTD